MGLGDETKNEITGIVVTRQLPGTAQSCPKDLILKLPIGNPFAENLGKNPPIEVTDMDDDPKYGRSK